MEVRYYRGAELFFSAQPVKLTLEFQDLVWVQTNVGSSRIRTSGFIKYGLCQTYPLRNPWKALNFFIEHRLQPTNLDRFS